MAKLQAKRIVEALKKAQRVGEVEEEVTVNGCTFVLRSLTPEEFESTASEIEELEDLAYIIAFKKGHLSRSLCEINGASLREFDFIEVDVEEPDVSGKMVTKTVSLERHKFVNDFVLATWSREAIDVAFRKFNDLTKKADDVAKEGVVFTIPDETPEEKYRRMISEARDLEGQFPIELSERILRELGYMKISSKDEIESVHERLEKVTSEESQETGPEEVAPTPTEEPVAVKEPSTRDLLKNRVPLNQRVVVPAPASVEAPAVPSGPVTPMSQETLRRAQILESLEELPQVPNQAPVPFGTRLTDGVPELSEPAIKFDPTAASQILDKPPTIGINPRFRPHSR